MNYPHVITQDSISVSINGDVKTIHKESSAYPLLKEALINKDWEKVAGLTSPADQISYVSDGKMRVSNNQVFLKVEGESDWPIPGDLNTKILDYLAAGEPFRYLILFADKIRRNPSKSSAEQLFTFLIKNKFTITPEGNFVAYKRVRNDFKDIYTGTMDNSIGKVVEMDRGNVNPDQHMTCSYGLHVANYDYAAHKYSQASEDNLLLVEVDPVDVVSVPTDYNNSKMRVCKYRVLELCRKELESLVYEGPEDSYEEEDDGEW